MEVGDRKKEGNFFLKLELFSEWATNFCPFIENEKNEGKS